jgi:8-oxo-dGTP pyrophosphatase MutT (NUDIX family)
MESSSAPFVAAVCVFAFRGDRLLALRRSPRNEAAPGAWEGISGRIEAGEQPEDAAVRETREETGLEVRLQPRPITAYRAQRRQKDMLVVVYRAEAEGAVVTLSDEHDGSAWVTVEEFARICPFPALVRAARLAAAAGLEATR